MEKEKFLFGKATLPKLDKTFGLRRVKEHEVLSQWLKDAETIKLESLEIEMCKKLRALLDDNKDGWQEQELSMHFIGPMFNLVEFFIMYKFNLFAQRPIQVEYEDYILGGTPDGIIATGYYEPEIPYFAFGEYKRNRDPDGDPAAQALSAMLAGQVMNQNKNPVYGCYVIGIHWYFMILSGKEYCILKDFSAVTDDIFKVLKTLKALKNIILKLIA